MTGCFPTSSFHIQLSLTLCLLERHPLVGTSVPKYIPHPLVGQGWSNASAMRKLHEADCHLRQTKPYSPWQQAAEGCVRELKWGVSRKMIKTGSPGTLWDHCIELEALIRSSTCNNMYMTNGKVPETIMTGSTADISHICEFGGYDWVMFRDNVTSFPDNKLVLGRYLGPATDVGSALTAKILKSNRQTVCRSTLRHLNDEELH